MALCDSEAAGRHKPWLATRAEEYDAGTRRRPRVRRPHSRRALHRARARPSAHPQNRCWRLWEGSTSSSPPRRRILPRRSASTPRPSRAGRKRLGASSVAAPTPPRPVSRECPRSRCPAASRPPAFPLLSSSSAGPSRTRPSSPRPALGKAPADASWAAAHLSPPHSRTARELALSAWCFRGGTPRDRADTRSSVRETSRTRSFPAQAGPWAASPALRRPGGVVAAHARNDSTGIARAVLGDTHVLVAPDVTEQRQPPSIVLFDEGGKLLWKAP